MTFKRQSWVYSWGNQSITNIFGDRNESSFLMVTFSELYCYDCRSYFSCSSTPKTRTSLYWCYSRQHIIQIGRKTNALSFAFIFKSKKKLSMVVVQTTTWHTQPLPMMWIIQDNNEKFCWKISQKKSWADRKWDGKQRLVFLLNKIILVMLLMMFICWIIRPATRWRQSQLDSLCLILFDHFSFATNTSGSHPGYEAKEIDNLPRSGI